jgi:hypothetical protein
MLIRWLPLIAGIVPFVGIHVCYVIAVKYGVLPACIPYVDGCTSISATGRYPPASFLFRAIELPVACHSGQRRGRSARADRLRDVSRHYGTDL